MWPAGSGLGEPRVSGFRLCLKAMVHLESFPGVRRQGGWTRREAVIGARGDKVIGGDVREIFLIEVKFT